MVDEFHNEYRVEYNPKLGDNAGKWTPRNDVHTRMEDALKELRLIKDCDTLYSFRIRKRKVSEWETVE